MKPVEVEILMKDRLSGALDKAGRKVDKLKGKATAASSEMDSQAQRLRTAIAGLTAQMEELRRVGKTPPLSSTRVKTWPVSKRSKSKSPNWNPG